jgi:hypothetical protein
MRRTARAEIDGGIGRHRDRGSADGEKKRKRGRERLHAQIERAKGFHRIRIPVAGSARAERKEFGGPERSGADDQGTQTRRDGDRLARHCRIGNECVARETTLDRY